ncbi:hypothetical protein JCM30394_36100 [Deferrisoma palaeochoriense]
MLTASGHFVVVEVKRFVNPELRDRRVIAQIVDYASAFAALDREDLLATFLRGDDPTNRTWAEFVAGCFPEIPEPEELANALAAKVASGRIHLVIACDKAPEGLDEAIRGVARQSALEFDLQLVEVTPHVRPDATTDDVVFVPQVRLKTEIVARTAVTVIYQEGQPRPSVEVRTTSLEEIEEGIRATEAGEPKPGRVWSAEEVEAAVREDGNPILQELFDFARTHSAGGQVVAPGRKVSPAFGFYVELTTRNGQTKRSMLFRCAVGWHMMTIYSSIPDAADPEIGAEFTRRLVSLFGEAAIREKKEPSIELEDVGRNIEGFKEAVLWLQDVLRRREA